MVTPRTHWGALLFTGAVAVAALLIGARLLSAPVSSGPAVAPDDPEPTPTPDMRVPLVQELHSRWYTQSVVPPLVVGEVADVTLQFINTGHVRWIRGTPSEVRLGETGDRPIPSEMRVGWLLPDRPAMQSELIVEEDQIATFTFKVSGAVPGTFRLHLQPVVDGVTWLDDEGVYVEIIVRDS